MPIFSARASITKKKIMALTGLVLSFFVIGHLAGNLLIFLGPDALNTYAKKIKDLPVVLWGMRGFLLLILLVHFKTGLQLGFQNKSARPEPYRHNATVRATVASRTMVLTGLLVLAFVVYHLLHFTLFWVHPQFAHGVDALGRHDVYAMVVQGFQVPLISAVYIAAMLVLRWHLYHGLAVFAQTMGWNDAARVELWNRFGNVFSWLIFVGYASIPVSVWTGAVSMGGGAS